MSPIIPGWLPLLINATDQILSQRKLPCLRMSGSLGKLGTLSGFKGETIPVPSSYRGGTVSPSNPVSCMRSKGAAITPDCLFSDSLREDLRCLVNSSLLALLLVPAI